MAESPAMQKILIEGLASIPEMHSSDGMTCTDILRYASTSNPGSNRLRETLVKLGEYCWVKKWRSTSLNNHLRWFDDAVSGNDRLIFKHDFRLGRNRWRIVAASKPARESPPQWDFGAVATSG